MSTKLSIGDVQEYPYIVAWGRMMGSFDYYIKMQIDRARDDKAPRTAIYKDRDTADWHTFENIKNNTTRAAVERIAGDMGVES